MSEYEQRSRRQQNQSSDDRELTSDGRGSRRKTPQFNDIGSQLSIEEILKEENEIFFNSERADWVEDENEFEESHDSAFERLVMEQRKEENEIFFSSGGDSQYDDVSSSFVEQEQVASVPDAGWGELENRENLSEEQIEAEREIAQEVLAGALMGDFNNDPTFWSDIGQIVTGLIPVAGQLGDARDLIHILDDITNKEGYKKIASWAGLVLIVIGFVPGVGDAIKSVGKRGLRYLDNNRILKRIGQFLGDNIISPILDVVGDITAPLVNQIKDVITHKLAEAQEIARQLGEGAGNVIDDVTGRPQLATEGAGSVPRSMEANPPVRGNEPMQSTGTPGSSGGVPSIKTTLGNSVFNNLAEELTEKEIQDIIAKHGVDLVGWLGKDLKGNAVQDVLTRLTPNALNDLQDITGQQVKRLLDEFGDNAVETLAPSLKGKGLDELSGLGMFKFDPAKQALLDAGQGQTVKNLPVLKGKTRAEIETILTQNGFTPPNAGTTSGQEMWLHPDGSVVRMKLGPAAFKNPRRPTEHLVREVSRKQPASSLSKDVFAKIAENGALIPAGPKFAEESLKQWFRKQTGRLPNPDELDGLMDIWGDAAHIDFLP